MLIRSKDAECINMIYGIDILEESIRSLDLRLLGIMLTDRTTQKNILWATEDYAFLGVGFEMFSEIVPNLITGRAKVKASGPPFWALRIQIPMKNRLAKMSTIPAKTTLIDLLILCSPQIPIFLSGSPLRTRPPARRWFRPPWSAYTRRRGPSPRRGWPGPW